MDKQKMALVGALVAFATLAVALTWKGIEVPAWLTGLLMAGGWLLKSPIDGKGGAQ